MGLSSGNDWCADDLLRSVWIRQFADALCDRSLACGWKPYDGPAHRRNVPRDIFDRHASTLGGREVFPGRFSGNPS